LRALEEGSTRNENSLSPEIKSVIDECIGSLEGGDKGVSSPTASGLINGRWKLLFTTRPGSSSPIQRAFTGVEAFSIYQDVDLASERPKVDNVVVFGDEAGVLRVEAEAVTDSRPRAGFVPRRGAGIPIFGKSDSSPPSCADKRIDFQFSKAAFDLKALPFKIPYPVPFRLLQDESKGWLDTTYLSPCGTFRISRGNKGTVFVLQKQQAEVEEEEEDYEGMGLLEVIRRGASARAVRAAIDKTVGEAAGSDSLDDLPGQWRLVWTSQGETASGIQKFATGFDNYQVIGGACETLQNVALFSKSPPIVLRAEASCALDPDEDRKLNVVISGAKLELGLAEIPLSFIKGTGFVKIQYVDDSIRISTGSKGSVFVHARDDVPDY